MTTHGIKSVRADCQPFLGLLRAGAGPLFRGEDANKRDAFIGEVRRDRIPRNMPRRLHDAGDKWFSETFGVRYRGAGLFCTGNRAQAAQFGMVYMIFPIGGFQFCWSPKVDDLHVWSKATGCVEIDPDTAKTKATITDADFVLRLGALDYREDDLSAATASGHEVMVACRTYHALAMDNVTGEDALLKELLRT